MADREFRERRRITLIEVAEATGIGRITLSRMLNHSGEPAEPPRISPARGPPAWDDPTIVAVPDWDADWDALAQPQPEYVFDQQVPW